MINQGIQSEREELLMWRMVQAMQIDLAKPVIDGTLPVARLQQMLRGCVKCPEPDLCARYLDTLADRPAEPPRYCPNRKVLKALGAAHG